MRGILKIIESENMIDLINNPGIMIFIFLWVSGTIMYGYSKDKMVLEYAMGFSILYGIFRIILFII